MNLNMQKPSFYLLPMLLITSNVLSAPQKILFGSCSHQDKPMLILDSVNREDADLFVFLGDNIYGDTENMQILSGKYKTLASNSRFAELRRNTPTIAIWDDHDFGQNDAGKHYPQKEASRKIMLDFWREPLESARRTQANGIYTSYFYGAADQSVHVILPDLRWNRDDIAEVGLMENMLKRRPKNMGPYKKTNIKGASMLGQEQWLWLEEELKKPASIKVIGSSVQLLADFTGWEAWANFPEDRARLFELIRKNRVNGVIVISGDTHWGEISKYEQQMDYPIWEITSSGLTQEWTDVSPNKHRVGSFTNKVNYGILEIDWLNSDPVIRIGLKDVAGKTVMQESFQLSSISPYQ